ncbi:hypothetical protein EHI8A_202970 [Entamoeba histolytica HM-1:IMSS-B]|uniref:Uncharacterized protein n=4 Tax=Entamoeba histolytica TaxID=5759 RepID=C4MBJ3_ENTH1|nr:hypothetical protein EHI_063580 [Entamoeba histolytica HM-1:IMSS]EAL42830.1 hypothetical protein EHI_063580 [Entamoeba histolytica HM-1:IMSS]EMD47233.1 Hypothetical protein EHI5A_191190 [Entamoeba histolytica KU27]EMH73452.1 hypothetical protein EHI8A_202970 [Entamoeba histolytica HM-1:IMSS-B]EMS15570.1 hypothetical protein KM1_239300 [Entamoeba histolytica HM-3:IMSS]|eukprot:XP_648218.1 hypothetical protein EHI_063580 [Entamoeba histolytica HM-1:IMSS]
MKGVINNEECPRCSIKRNLFIKINKTKLEIGEKEWICSIQFISSISKSKSSFIPLLKGENRYDEVIIFPYIHYYNLNDFLLIKLFKKSKKENKQIGGCKFSLQETFISEFKGNLQIIGIGKFNGKEFGELNIEASSMPSECCSINEINQFQKECLTEYEQQTKIFNGTEKIPEKRSRAATLRRVMHLQKKEQTQIIEKRILSPREEEQTEVDDIHEDLPLKGISDGIIIIVQAKKKRSEQIRKIIESSNNYEKYHFVEVFNGDFNEQVIPFLIENARNNISLPIVLCGGDWFIGLFVRQLSSINQRKKIINVLLFFIPTTKNCLIAKELGKIDFKYKANFCINWLNIMENDKEKALISIEEYLCCKCLQKMILSEVNFFEGEKSKNIPMIISAKVICGNKTVTVDYWKLKDKKIQVNKMKKSFDSIEIYKENKNDNFIMIPFKIGQKNIEKEEDHIICNKIIITSDNFELKIIVDRMVMSSNANYITFKLDLNGNSFSIQSFN